MAKHPAEVFGHSIKDTSNEAKRDRRKRWCPFVNEKCNKRSRLIKYPMGVCSVRFGEEIVALSPRRFLQENIVFKDIADHYFNTRHDIVVFNEVKLPSIGNFDFVMVKHKPLSTEIEDFAIVEFQTAQTTMTGKLVNALKEFLGGEEIEGKTYGFGLNYADIWKRTFTQILNKGIVIEEWGSKIYWVIQEPIYNDFLNRYRLDRMTFSESHNTVFAIYDLVRAEAGYELCRTRFESSTIGALFEAFSTNPNIPSKDTFISKLQGKLKNKMHLKLKLDHR